MEDALTEAPPSRFFLEDLNNLTPPSPPLPSPFLLFSPPSPSPTTTPSLLIISISTQSLHLLNHLSSKTLIGTLILPELPFSPTPKPFNIYSLSSTPSTLFLSIPISVPTDRSHAVAKLIVDQIRPERVVILDSVQSRNFRGKLPPDEALGFKLETTEEKLNAGGGGLDWFPSGSVVDGLGAAILSRCEIKRIKATLCVTWPEFGSDAVALVKSLLENAVPKVEFGGLGFERIRDSRFDSELYT